MSIETIALLMALFDNYAPFTTDQEIVTPEEEVETNEFLDAVIASDVMQAAYQFLLEKGEFSL